MSHWLDTILALFRAETSDLRELARIAGGDPRTFYRGIKLQNLDVEGQNIDGMEFSDPLDEEGILIFADSQEEFLIPMGSIIKAIKRVTRQEERLSLLLRLILENRAVGLAIIESYDRDKAKYTNVALQQLRIALQTERDQMSIFDSEPMLHGNDELAHIAYYPFSRGMPSNRTLLLYYMSQHLAGDTAINAYLESRLESSKSMFLEKYRKEIKKTLNHPTQISWMEIVFGKNPQFSVEKA